MNYFAFSSFSSSISTLLFCWNLLIFVHDQLLDLFQSWSGPSGPTWELPPAPTWPSWPSGSPWEALIGNVYKIEVVGTTKGTFWLNLILIKTIRVNRVAVASRNLVILTIWKPLGRTLRNIHKIEVVCTTEWDILTESYIDQDHQGQYESCRPPQIGHHDYLEAPRRHFWEKFIKQKLFVPLEGTFCLNLILIKTFRVNVGATANRSLAILTIWKPLGDFFEKSFENIHFLYLWFGYSNGGCEFIQDNCLFYFLEGSCASLAAGSQ